MTFSDSLSFPTIEHAYAQAVRRRVLTAIASDVEPAALDEYSTVVAELVTWDSLGGEGLIKQELRDSAKRAHALLQAEMSEFGLDDRTLSTCLRTASLAVLADQPQDARKLLRGNLLVAKTTPESDWAEYTQQTVYLAWLGLIRQDTLGDVEYAKDSLVKLRELQKHHEKDYLFSRENESARRSSALQLVALYFLGTAAERLSEYLIRGTADGGADINIQLDMYFDRCLRAMDRAPGVDGLDVMLLLQPTSHQLAASSLRAATRSANTLTRKFVDSLIQRPAQPLFQLLPPQRVALRDQGLMGSNHRSIVVNFPTSSGKTLLAEFGILQALNDLGEERGWVAYVAPTRALVNQITSRLRRDFEPLGKRVERLSPALEFDSIELSALIPGNPNVDGPPVDVLVCTPEKLDLLVRREELCSSLGRLALLVVDEAHGIGATDSRAIKLELLLSMVNREQEGARFLLLTPFIKNADRVASWLDQTSCKDYSIEAEWVPNDRIIGIAKPPPKQRHKKGTFADHVLYHPIATPKRTLHIDELLRLEGLSADLQFTSSKLHSSGGALATATAQVLSSRGPTVLLCRTVRETWTSAANLALVEWPKLDGENERLAVSQFVVHELGESAELAKLLLVGIAVHHAGLPEEVAQAIEWLFERRYLHVLCATTTLAQGVNFPIANLVLSSIYPVGSHGQQMPFSDFWNIAGRVGRVDQDAIGIVALTAKDEQSEAKNEEFLKRSMHQLVSSLVEMVADLSTLAQDKGLGALTWKKEWSNFCQFIAHTLRQVGPAKFADQVELVLRGTFGFQLLREQKAHLARELLVKTRQYAAEISRDMGSVKLVDATGFSFESVRKALAGLSDIDSLDDFLRPSLLFSGQSHALQDVMGVLLEIPEVREDLVEIGYGEGGALR